ncbi:MAG TPA: response regulator transcription factor [Candidatus Merdivicinus excrementipullorum]|uniref:Stage 0 sporulation protein A homolog n=1 Tax=Candidatus Merdivicinus excrementipullorum TaxID=2840867 RepID=A0A9D1JZX5_9FIRM|nr:response regulator transcription factor [Candidatus Merdivicinus excrementipullorum]
MKRILVCEDEDTIREFVVINLQRSGYSVVDVNCGEEALRVYDEQNGDFDVALLDVTMPGMDGFTLCKKLRERSETLGIIFLTARSQEIDRVGGLMMGADDYVTKPFSPSEVVARVDAVYRRVSMVAGKPKENAEIRSGPFVLNIKSRTLNKNGKPIDLTQVEYQIVELLLKNKGSALDRNKILSEIWGENYYSDVKIVDVNIRRLRIKVEDEPSMPVYIQTVWGYGYKWGEPV